MPALAVVLFVALAFVAGFFVDRLFFGAATKPAIAGRLTLSEGQLDEPVASYVYGGKTVTVSAREVLEHEGQLDGARNDDGSYDVPTADAVLATVRGQIIAADAQDKGIEVGEEDMLAYAEATLGTRDLSTVASTYGQSEEAVRAQLSEAALMARLRDTVAPALAVEAPAMPEEPAEGEEVAETEGYAAYIRDLAGDAWDGEAGAWRDPENPYAVALADYDLSDGTASHEAALQAYWVAYDAYTSENAGVSAQWTDYVNGLLSEASLNLSSLAI